MARERESVARSEGGAGGGGPTHIKIFTNKLASCASAMAHELPAMPTQMPEPRLVRPTLMPDQKIEYAANRAPFRYAASCGPPCGITSGSFIFPERMMARMMP